MPVLRVRMSEREKRLLASRAKMAGVSMSALVREWIGAAPIETGQDVLVDMLDRLGDKRLRVRRMSA